MLMYVKGSAIKTFLIGGKSRVNPDVESDIHDPNYYCRSCEITLTRQGYQSHLRSVHGINDAKLLSLRPKPNYNITPDPNDPDCYCLSCDHKYFSRQQFHRHMRNIHGLRPKSQIFDCEACQTTYESKKAFQEYAKEYHNYTRELYHPFRDLPNFTIVPDVDNPIYYCKSCKLPLFRSRAIYHRHLKNNHGFKLSQLESSDTLSIVENALNDISNRNCQVCKKSFSSRSSYITHCRTVHNVAYRVVVYRPNKFPPYPDPSILPDPQDPNFYCKSCNRTYTSSCTYRVHIKRVHHDPMA